MTLVDSRFCAQALLAPNTTGLTERVREALASGGFSKADEAELEEMRWMHVRACQVAAAEKKAWRAARRTQQRRMRDIARQARMHLLLNKMSESTCRCNCHDFDFWATLWKYDAAMALGLRRAGLHFEVCRLAARPAGADRAFDVVKECGTLTCPSSGKPIHVELEIF